MSLETDLHSRLAGYAGLTALVGSRVYPLVAPTTAALPYCVHQLVGELRQYSHQGFENLTRHLVQVSCFAKDATGSPGYSKVRTIAAQVIAAMEGWPAANANVGACFLDDGEDLYEEATLVYHVPLTFVVWYRT